MLVSKGGTDRKSLFQVLNSGIETTVAPKIQAENQHLVQSSVRRSHNQPLGSDLLQMDQDKPGAIASDTSYLDMVLFHSGLIGNGPIWPRSYLALVLSDPSHIWPWSYLALILSDPSHIWPWSKIAPVLYDL